MSIKRHKLETHSKYRPIFVAETSKFTLKMEPRHQTINTDGGSSFFLTGAILFANLDATGLAEYALKAAIGGAIWLVFKVAGEYIGTRFKNKG